MVMLRRAMATAAALAALTGLTGVSGCNGILGIDKASLIPAEASVSGLGATSYELTCANYCRIIHQACAYSADGASDDTEYLNDDTCLSMCPQFDVTGEVLVPGTPPSSSDTLNCRLWYANKALDGDPHLECPRAGPLGGKVCDGQGDPCEAFCRLDVAFCMGDAAAYTGYDDCVAACEVDGGYPGFPYVVGPDPDDTDLASGYGGMSTLNCRIYHLENFVAFGEVAHCSHTSAGGGGICVGALPDQ
jgi:hypothetical protein